MKCLRWTADGCALALAWTNGGMSMWSVFGALLMCTLGGDFGFVDEGISVSPWVGEWGGDIRWMSSWPSLRLVSPSIWLSSLKMADQIEGLRTKTCKKSVLSAQQWGECLLFGLFESRAWKTIVPCLCVLQRSSCHAHYTSIQHCLRHNI